MINQEQAFIKKVRMAEGVRQSLLSGITPICNTVYPINKWASSTCGPLFVYRDGFRIRNEIPQVERWHLVHLDPYVEYWLVRVHNARPVNRRLAVHLLARTHTILEFWCGRITTLGPAVKCRDDVYVADKVKLLKRLWPH